ncbi:MAG TPA: hypothetical protein VEV17_15050 [Bryobacteraceae bacterium]|nr:hypothetical protein [Bryobacteraceae bacterium]
MKRTTVFLPDDLHEQLRLEAFRSRQSMAQVIRFRLESASRRKKPSGPRPDPLLKVAGICRGPVLSKSIDEELYGI